jgi:hypothetical protein
MRTTILMLTLTLLDGFCQLVAIGALACTIGQECAGCAIPCKTKRAVAMCVVTLANCNGIHGITHIVVVRPQLITPTHDGRRLTHLVLALAFLKGFGELVTICTFAGTIT